MDPKSLEIKKDARRQQIAEAATRLIADNGTEGLRMKALAASLGLTAGALYRYFPSKDHLLAEVEGAVLGDIADCMAMVVRATSSLRPIEALAALVDAYGLIEHTDSPHFQVLTHFIAPPRALLDDELASTVMPHVTRLFALMAGVLRRARTDGQLEDGDDMQRAAVLWSGLHGVLERRKLARFGLDGLHIETLYRQTAASLLRGWGLAPGDADELFARSPEQLRPLYHQLIGELS